jgi:hypothetical protein
VELTRSSSSSTHSTDAAHAQEGPANFDVSVGFVIATFFGSNLFFLTVMTGSPLPSSGILCLHVLLASSWLGGIDAMVVWTVEAEIFWLFIDNRFHFVCI